MYTRDGAEHVGSDAGGYVGYRFTHNTLVLMPDSPCAESADDSAVLLSAEPRKLAVALADEWVTLSGASRVENARSMRECRLFLMKSDHLPLMRCCRWL